MTFRWKKTKEKSGTEIDVELSNGEPWESPHLRLHVSYGDHKFRGFSLKFNDEERGATGFLGLHIFSLWLTAGNVIPRKTVKAMYAWAKAKAEASRTKAYAYQLDPMGRTIFSFSEHDGAFWFKLWSNGDWSRGDLKKAPWNGNGWDVNWSWLDTLLGKIEYEERLVSSNATTVEMREGTYPAKVTVHVARWRRKRNTKHANRWQHRASVDVAGGVPVPGKGSTSYNIGDGALYGTTFPAQDGVVEDGQPEKDFANSVMATRRRYASPTWVPSDGWPTHCERS